MKRTGYTLILVLLACVGLFALTPTAHADPESEKEALALFREGRDALGDNNYGQARRLFRAVRVDYPSSEVGPDAMYWEAFALYRIGNTESLREAAGLLDSLLSANPGSGRMAGDAKALLGRIDGALAQKGDAESAERVVERASESAERDAARVARDAERQARSVERGHEERYGDEEDDLKIAALNALMQMDEDRAMPILKKLLANQDQESAHLRAKAVFLVAQIESEETADLLLDIARNDADSEVREQAVFWLSQVDDERAMEALEGLLKTSDDPAIQEKAVFAISQHDSPRAAPLLRDIAGDRTRDLNVREQAVFWLGQSDDEGSLDFLMGLYDTADASSMREKIIFSVAQLDDDDDRVAAFLVEIALDDTESLEMRKQALFWAGEEGQISVADLQKFYTSVDDRDLRQQVIFVLAQQGDDPAVEALIEIVRVETNVELRKQAIFWLGETDNDRAYDFINELLEP